MTLPPLPNCASTAIVYEQFGQEIVNVIKWEIGAEVDLSQLQELTGVLWNNWGNNIMAFLSFQIEMVRIEGRQLVPLSGVAYDFVGDGPIPGESTVDADNSQNATVVSLRTGQAGRSYRGRLYIPGMPNNIVQDGLVDGTYRTNLAAAVKTTFDAVTGGSGFTPVVVSYFGAGAQRVVPVTTPIETALSATPYPGIQRRRRVGVGN
jgi:hypothetical protein